MKNTIHLSSETTISYHYKPERDELSVQLRPSTGAVQSEALDAWEHVQLQREQSSGEVVGFIISSVQQVLLEQLVRGLATSLQPYFESAPRPTAEETAESLASEATVSDEAEASVPVEEAPESPAPEAIASDEAVAPAEEWVPAGEAGETQTLETGTSETPSVEAEALDVEVTPTDPASESAPPAPKKSRSRRRKGKKEAQPEAVAELDAILTSEEESQIEAPSEEAPATEIGIELVEAVAREEIPAETSSESETPTAEATEAVAETPAVATDEVSGEAVAQVAREESPAPKKSRSRRGKGKKAEATEAATPVAEEIPNPLTDGGAANAAVEGGTVEVEATESATEAAIEDPTEAVAETTPKKSRSRRKKKSDPVAETSTPDVAPVAESATPELIAPVEEVTIEAVEPATREAESEAVAEDEGDDAEGEETVSEGDATAVVAGEPGKRKRRKRRKRRNGGTTANGESGVVAETPAVAAAPVPAPTRQPHYATTTPAPQSRPESERAPAQRSVYKSEPIEGLDAPDEFQFMELDPLIGQALHAMGYESPTAIQRRAVPDAMARRDIVGLAQTGTGKTLAFLLPSLHHMLKNPLQGHRPRLLVLTPTRELALQVATEAEYLATHTDFVIAPIYGQEDMKRQIRLLRDGVDIVVATPGRLLDHLQRGTIRLNTVETVVLDEADRMLDMGFLPDVRKILNRVPNQRQTMMFSATMPQAVQSLSLDFQRDPVMIEVARQLPPAQIDQKLYPVERHLKIPLLEHLMKGDTGMRSVMIFTETKAEADIVHRKLNELGFDPAVMHGDISQRERERALEHLRSGKVRMLVATNVAARGLDIQDVTHVINYEVPQTVDDYVHRIGRTARGEGTEGTAITFVSSGDDGMIKRIESALERPLPRVYAEGFNYAVPTPSWAKPSADDIAESLTKPKNLAERFKHMMRRR